MDSLTLLYPWIKAAHLIFVIFWMAGLFMLPRFFVYHQESAAGSAESDLWVERERRLLRIILNPSMIITWVLGLVLVYQISAFQEGWFHVKFLFVFLLSGYHGWMAGYARKLARGERRLTGKKLRLLNEVPGIATAVIVIMVIVKPF
jgi:protoporphyrinogen IX oxidase